MPERLAIFISGEGTTMAEIIRACDIGAVRLKVGCVIANTRKAAGLQKAIELGVPERDVLVISPASHRNAGGVLDESGFAEEIIRELRAHSIDVVTANGYLQKMPRDVVRAYEGRIFNQHPGPVPAFGGKGMYGRRVHQAVLAFRKLGGEMPATEVIAQRLAEEFDDGEIVGSERILIHENDTPETLAARALPIEHALQIQLLRDVVGGNVTRAASKITIRDDQRELLETAKRMAIGV